MIELKKEFRKGGKRDFLQIEKNDRFAIYQVTAHNEMGVDVYFEVFAIKIMGPTNIVNDTFERYPGDEDFGKWAFCCLTLDRCYYKINKYFEECEEWRERMKKK
jgi:hypothetical protein